MEIDISTRHNTAAQLYKRASLRLLVPFFAVCFNALFTNISVAADTPDPSTVTIPGNLQESLGCSGNWQPDCSNTYLSRIETADVWKANFNIVVGDYEYKAALNDSWDENYGKNAQRDGPNIQLFLDADTPVSFYYDHQTNWVTDNQNSRIAIAAGSFQEFFGCSGNWQPDCLNSWLKDPEGDGVYTTTTTNIPAGDYEAKVTINESWDENYGQGGILNGANITFSVPEDGAEMFFRFDTTNNTLTIKAGGEPNGSLDTSRAHWLSGDIDFARQQFSRIGVDARRRSGW